MAIQNCADWVEGILDNYPTTAPIIRGTSAYPLDKPTDPGPFAFVVIGPTTYNANSAGWGTDLYSLKVYLVTSLAQGVKLAVTSLGDLPATLAHAFLKDTTMGGAASTFDRVSDTGWTTIDFNGILYGGYILTIEGIKLHSTL